MSTEASSGTFQQAAELLRAARRVLVLCGAGLSASSGIPVFRGAGGLWKQFRAEDLATPQAFARMPEEVWSWYRWRREMACKARPNEGHRALARLTGERDLVIINQNVDGLLERAHDEAGCSGEGIIRVHGSLHQAHCQRCSASRSMDDLPAEGVPRCSCGGPLRPSVVWFGEALAPEALRAIAEEPKRRELLLVVGTSAQVWPAAGVIPAMRAAGGTVVVINAECSELETGMLNLEGDAARVLPQLIEAAL